MVHESWSLQWCQDSNPRPSSHESSALTRPRLLAGNYLLRKKAAKKLMSFCLLCLSVFFIFMSSLCLNIFLLVLSSLSPCLLCLSVFFVLLSSLSLCLSVFFVSFCLSIFFVSFCLSVFLVVLSSLSLCLLCLFVSLSSLSLYLLCLCVFLVFLSIFFKNNFVPFPRFLSVLVLDFQ